MTAAYIAIGNSDDKLPQAAWSSFVTAVSSAVTACAENDGAIHFAGFSGPAAPWQNAAWIIELPEDEGAVAWLRSRLREIAGTFRQDSIAWGQVDALELLTPLDPRPRGV